MSVGVGLSYGDASSSYDSSYKPMPLSQMEHHLNTEFWQNFLGHPLGQKYKYNISTAMVKHRNLQIYGLEKKIAKAESDGNTRAVKWYKAQLVKVKDSLDSLERKAETYEPDYKTEAEKKQVGIDKAHEDILGYLDETAPTMAESYGNAGTAFGAQNNELFDSIMEGTGLSPVTLENINNLAKGVEFGLGGESMGSFVPRGNASALESILANRTANMGEARTTSEGILGNANQTTDMIANIGLTPLQAKLQNAERPTVQQMLSGSLWDMVRPMTELRYITGGPEVDANSDSSSYGLSVGAG